MCRQVRCRQCAKTTWSGCGQHVDQVMAGVPAAQQCSCGTDAPSSSSKGFWSSLLGR